MLNQNIAYYRKAVGLTQEQLAERLGVTGQTLSKWENSISSPDVAILPQLAASLGVDINALFAEDAGKSKAVRYTELPELCCDAVLSLYVKALYDFYGKKAPDIDAVISEKVRELKKEFAVGRSKCGYMIDEGSPEHGAVFVSDDFTFIDRSYGGEQSALLFDADMAGEVLSVLGNRNCRLVLKVIYQRQISTGDTLFGSLSELAEASGLTEDAAAEAAARLRHVQLLDEIEKFEHDGFKREYSGLYATDLMYVLAILRLAHIFTSNMLAAPVMYRNALNMTCYNGPGL